MNKNYSTAGSRQIMRQGGLAAWSIRHPVGVSAIALAVIVLGIFALGKLAIDLLPHIIYPDVRVRIIDPGVPAKVMEDRITRQLEEQLAITEDAVSVQSSTSQGLSTVDLSFEYGKDIDIALRDASTRLDRAKRFLPDTINPPVIYKRDPSQISILEFVVSSQFRDAVELRSWTDDVLRKWFLNLPGVAAAEVGGGMEREIHIIPDQHRLSGVGLSLKDLSESIQRGNQEEPTGRLRMSAQELSGRVSGRFNSIAQISDFPLELENGETILLKEVASIVDTHEDERLRVRANGVPGVKLSIQKQPTANTVSVVDVVHERLDWLKKQGILPEDIEMLTVSDQSTYIRQSLKNSSIAAISGALLAMTVVYFFLGNFRRTLIIGSAIPIAIMVTFVLMSMGGLTLNVMTLGGLALGVGMLVDNTIVMLENIYRHQQLGDNNTEAAINAAKEVNSPIVASTSTNLAAVLPFLFIGGLTGLLFQELIITIAAAIAASMVIALTLVPALAGKVGVSKTTIVRKVIDKLMSKLQALYAKLVELILRVPWLIILLFITGLTFTLPTFFSAKQIFLPKLDDGRVTVRISTDPGGTLDEMDKSVIRLEKLFNQQPETESVFTLAGGFIFGRTEREAPNRTTMTVQLKPVDERTLSSEHWIKRMKKAVNKLKVPGLKVRMYQRGIRGVRTNRGDDDISLRIQGEDLSTLTELADDLVEKLKSVEGLRNFTHSAEEEHFELSINVDRNRASSLGFDITDVSEAMQIALQGVVITDYIEGDKSYFVRLRLLQSDINSPEDLNSIILFPANPDQPTVYLGDVAEVVLIDAPSEIKRDNQLRIVEVSATIKDDSTLGEVINHIDEILAEIAVPKGYNIYEGGAKKTLQEGKQLSTTLLALALFLVFVVMAVQYESLLNPLIIIVSVPFAVIGVSLGITYLNIPISMPVWLGMIMLAGIVVNNTIVLVETIEILREQGNMKLNAIIEAARLRLRPILMTTLTTVVGMLPLALGLGEGAEMLQPLAITITWGLSFSMLVSLLLVPAMYSLFHGLESEPIIVRPTQT